MSHPNEKVLREAYAEFSRGNLGITASEMVSRVEGKLRSMQVPEPAIRQSLQGIPSLGRWRTKQESAR